MRETQESQKDLDKQVEKRGCVLPVFDPFEHQLESLHKDTLPGAGNDISYYKSLGNVVASSRKGIFT